MFSSSQVILHWASAQEPGHFMKLQDGVDAPDSVILSWLRDDASSR